jgi:hypothetical protein
MSITYPVSFPSSIGISKFTLRYVKAVAKTESPFNYKQQVHDFGGGRWEAEVTIPPLNTADSLTFQAFLVSLHGCAGTFTMAHPLHNTAGVSRRITGSVGDNDVDFNGSVSAGMYFEANDHLYLTLESGTSNVAIQPPLRNTFSNSLIDATLPAGTWRLASSQVEWTTDSSSNTPFTFACVEAL